MADPQTSADDAAAAGDPPGAAPRQSFMSSLSQAFKQDFDHEVVRGHFDVGGSPDTRRYYCLVDEKTGKRQPNGVPGEPVHRPDGMTGIKASSVATYTCASAEEQGSLVTTGYVLKGSAASGAVLGKPAAAAVPAAPKTAAASALSDTSPGRVDVAGVRLGMTPAEVRSVLKVRGLLDYYESMQPLGEAHFLNTIAAWTTAPMAGDEGAQDGESYEVMFTPVPGRERVMAIVHTVAIAGAGSIREKSFGAALVRKYGGFSAGAEVPAAPTWRVQGNGSVEVGDPCSRRNILAAQPAFAFGSVARQNIALKTTLDEFRFQIQHCGVAIVTADHVVSGGGSGPDERTIKRYTVTAYGPSIGFDGASAAAQLMQPAGSQARPGAARPDAAREVLPKL